MSRQVSPSTNRRPVGDPDLGPVAGHGVSSSAVRGDAPEAAARPGRAHVGRGAGRGAPRSCWPRVARLAPVGWLPGATSGGRSGAPTDLGDRCGTARRVKPTGTSGRGGASPASGRPSAASCGRCARMTCWRPAGLGDRTARKLTTAAHHRRAGPGPPHLQGHRQPDLDRRASRLADPRGCESGAARAAPGGRINLQRGVSQP
jgi:hypothetical protein